MSYIEVKALSQKYCDELIDQANQHPELYQNHPSSFPLREDYAKGSTMIYLKKDVLNNLIIEGAEKNRAKNDAHNCKVFYNALVFRDAQNSIERVLTPLEASDRRIWMYLSHSAVFWKYLNIRWGGPTPDISSRFLISGNSSNLTPGKLIRHGIARLWWCTALSYDEKNHADPYELLSYLFHTTDFQLQLTDRRAISDNQNVLKSYLKFLKSDKAFLNESKNRKLAKAVTAETGIRDLPMLEEKELFELIKEIAKGIN